MVAVLGLLFLLSMADCCAVAGCCAAVCRFLSVLSACGTTVGFEGIPRAVASACERSEGVAGER